VWHLPVVYSFSRWGDPVQSDDQTSGSEGTEPVRDHVRTRLQTLPEHLHAKQQSQRSGSGAASIKTDRENNGSGNGGHA
jgi:hypothetical protein